MHQFIYNGKRSQEFGLVLSGEDVWETAVPDLVWTSIPGRNGDLLMSNHRYKNVDIKYAAGVKKFFPTALAALTNFLLQDPGYHRLEDSYHPEYYRIAAMATKVEAHPGTLNQSGTIDITFTCKPQKFLKIGERVQEFSANGVIFNPTLFESRPLIRVYGTGQVQIGAQTFELTADDGYTDVDSDMQDAFCGITNRNENLRLTSGDFPTLPPGETNIVLGSGISKLEITPRWWCL